LGGRAAADPPFPTNGRCHGPAAHSALEAAYAAVQPRKGPFVEEPHTPGRGYSRRRTALVRPASLARSRVLSGVERLPILASAPQYSPTRKAALMMRMRLLALCSLAAGIALVGGGAPWGH